MELRLHITHMLSLDDRTASLMRQLVNPMADIRDTLTSVDRSIKSLADEVGQLHEEFTNDSAMQDQIDELTRTLDTSSDALEHAANRTAPMPTRPSAD